ncbi:MAG TPA: hypothetical protein VFP37_06605 [Steroidobacteraceae bacterium]|nr:hypothetical protein [Steroidobacteraceae bacterium]
MNKMKVLTVDGSRSGTTGLLNAVALLALVLLLSACGGGGGGGSSAPTSGQASSSSGNSAPVTVTPPASAASDADSADLELAGRLYDGDARTPEGFDVESRPANVAGTISTRHLRNTDLATGPQAITPVFEVCTNDMAQAIDWSERQATWQGQYSDLVEVKSDDRMFEIVRVPRADVSAMLRHRVFRCDYLDRSGSDLRADDGSAGSMNQRPLTAAELDKLAEYLWQFTVFNNSEYAVESSSTTTNGNTIVQTIRMGQMIRGTAGSCDTVKIIDWTHTMDATDGSLTRTLSDVRSFQVKSTAGGIESCRG